MLGDMLDVLLLLIQLRFEPGLTMLHAFLGLMTLYGVLIMSLREGWQVQPVILAEQITESIGFVLEGQGFTSHNRVVRAYTVEYLPHTDVGRISVQRLIFLHADDLSLGETRKLTEKFEKNRRNWAFMGGIEIEVVGADDEVFSVGRF